MLVPSMFDTWDNGTRHVFGPMTSSLSPRGAPTVMDLEDPTVWNTFPLPHRWLGHRQLPLFCDFDTLPDFHLGLGVSCMPTIRTQWIFGVDGSRATTSTTAQGATFRRVELGFQTRSSWALLGAQCAILTLIVLGRAGCHVDMTEHVLDQLNQYDSNGQSLVQDPDLSV